MCRRQGTVQSVRSARRCCRLCSEAEGLPGRLSTISCFRERILFSGGLGWNTAMLMVDKTTGDADQSRYAGQTKNPASALGYSRVVFIPQVAARKQPAADRDGKGPCVEVINDVLGPDAARRYQPDAVDP